MAEPDPPLTQRQEALLQRLATLGTARTLAYLAHDHPPHEEDSMSGDSTAARIPGPLYRRAHALIPSAERYPDLLGPAHTSRITRSTVIREALSIGLKELEGRVQRLRRIEESRRIKGAREAAGQRGDLAAIRLCDQAIGGDHEARRELLAALDAGTVPGTLAGICQSGTITGRMCSGEPDCEVEHMPVYLRASHEAGGHRGTYPHNGAIRLRVCPECRSWLLAEPGGWSFEVRS